MKKKSEWDKVKERGNTEYKSGVDKVEPIDLFKDGNMLWDWCTGEIIAKAYRIRRSNQRLAEPKLYSFISIGQVQKDLDEIIHHTEMLKAVINEATRKK